MNIETTRLILRRSTLADVPTLFEFLGDAEAMRHTHIDASLRACRRRVAVHEWCRRRDGYAPWTVVTKTDARIVGWGGLYNDPFEPGWGVEVGYFFHPAAWGLGYATELVAACIDVADNILQLPEVSAFAHPENIGSRRVLEKAGFEVVRFVPKMDRFLFRRTRSVTNGPSQGSRINRRTLQNSSRPCENSSATANASQGRDGLEQPTEHVRCYNERDASLMASLEPSDAVRGGRAAV